MTIEVRQLLIKSEVGEREPPARDATLPVAVDPEQLKREIVATMKAWLAQQLQKLQER
jgi:hypothetical protein